MKEVLNNRIQHLHDLLEDKSVDQASGKNLKKLSNELDTALASGNSDVNRAFGNELEQEALKFEENHPAVAQVIREIMHTLQSVGI